MEKIDATVIIWGNDNYHVSGLLRQLSPYVSNVVFLVNNRKYHCATISKYCKHYQVVSGINAGLEYLLDFGKSLNEKAFIITTSDLLAAAIDQNSKLLSPYYYLCTTKEQGALTKVLNKNYQCEIAEQAGIHVPESKEFYWNSSIEGITYPCLIKPSFKVVGVHHPFKTMVCRTPDELICAQNSLDKQGTYTLQQLINKEKDILVYGCRLEDGSIIYAGSFIKYRWANNGDGSFGTISPDVPECINKEHLNSFMNKIEYYGLFSAEFGFENNAAWFYEFNLRNDGTSHYFYQAFHVNLPLLWVKDHLGVFTWDRIENKHNAIFIDEINDIDNVRAGRITKSEWRKDYRKATVFKYYDRKDRKPYYYEKTKQYLRELYHKIKRQ